MSRNRLPIHRGRVLRSLAAAACVHFSVFLLVPTALADGPVSLNDIAEMRKNRVPLSKIMRELRERGRAFEIDAASRDQLLQQGLSGRAIAVIEKNSAYNAAAALEGGFDAPGAGVAGAGVAGAGVAGPGPGVGNGGAEGGAMQPGGGALGVPPGGGLGAAPAQDGGFKPDAADLAQYEQMEKIIKRTMEITGLGLVATDNNHIRIIANPQLGQRFAPDVRRIEGIIKQQFPQPLASGVDKRHANVAIFPIRSEYEKWIKAYLRAVEEAGGTWEKNAEELAVKASSVHFPGLYNICLEGMPEEAARRSVAYSVGYLYMGQLTRYKTFDALQTGFGNITEVMLFRTPSVMVKSGYVDRQIGGGGNPWADAVRAQFQAGRIQSIDQVTTYSTDFMEMPHYAEAWSLTTLLATNAKQFAELVMALRNGGEGLNSVLQTYKLEQQAMLKAWFQFAQRMR